MQKEDLIKGTFILWISGIIAKFLGIFFRIPLTNLIGEEGIGLYQLTYPLYTMLLALSAGIPTAISKMISERTAIYRNKEAHRIFKAAFFLLLIFGSITSACIIIFAWNIINGLGWSSYAYYSLLGISLAPFFTCILSAFKGYFQGLRYMQLPAISQVVEQAVRVIVGVSLAYFLLPYGIHASAGGASFGAAAGSLAGALLLAAYYKNMKLYYEDSEPSKNYSDIIFEILKIALPISLAQAMGSLMSLIDSAIVPKLLIKSGYSYQSATVLYGQLTGKAFVLISVPLTISNSLSQNTVPEIAASFALSNKKKLNKSVADSYKLALLLVLPACAGLYVLAKPIMGLIFQNMSDGWEMLQILSIAAIFITIAQTSTSILNGVGKTLAPMYAILIGVVVKVAFCYAFIPKTNLNIKAAAYGTLFSYIIISLIDIFMVYKYTDIKTNLFKIALSPVICTLIMIFSVVVVYNSVYNLLYKNDISTIISILAGIIVYFICILATKTMSLKEIKAVLKR